MGRLNLGGCIVSKNILEGKGTIKWCFRETPSNELDNGWRFLSDIDTEEFLSFAENMAVCAWETIINIEPAVTAMFDSGGGFYPCRAASSIPMFCVVIKGINPDGNTSGVVR